jgi:streptogramin lyase
MNAHRVGPALAIGVAAFALVSSGQFHAQSSTTNPYRASVGWEKLPAGRPLGVVSGVFPDPDGRHVWILDRCGGNQCAGTNLNPIMKFDLKGNLVDSIGAGLFAFPHGFFLDHEGFLWVTEGGAHGDDRAAPGEKLGLGHQVLKLTQRGDVVMRLGEAGVWGDGPNRFNGPSGVAVAANGDIWVADGHRGGNNRIVKFSRDGKFLLAVGGGVGSESKEAARFSDPHDIKIDSRGRVYVADRGNSRIQVFDQTGKLLYIWTHYGKPSGLFIDRNDVLYAGDGLSGMNRSGPPDPWRSNFGWEKGIRIGDLKTEQAWVTHFVPHHEEETGAGIEFLGVDFDGTIYAGEVARQRLVRYVPFRPPEVLGDAFRGRGAR